MDTKIRSICIDTLTGIQSEIYNKTAGKPGFDKWRDWGKDIWNLNSSLQDLGFETILILGQPGVGYMFGIKK